MPRTYKYLQIKCRHNAATTNDDNNARVFLFAAKKLNSFILRTENMLWRIWQKPQKKIEEVPPQPFPSAEKDKSSANTSWQPDSFAFRSFGKKKKKLLEEKPPYSGSSYAHSWLDWRQIESFGM